MGARWTIGLVGEAGSGKSTVRAWLAGRGAATLDGDAVVHQVLAEDRSLIESVVARFGEEVRAGSGAIDRAALARIVFRDPVALADLEGMVHPAVIAVTMDWLGRVEAEVAVVEAIKLVESGLAAALDQLWLVLCDARARRVRLAERGWSDAEIEGRRAAAPSLPPMLALADVIIDNSGSWAATERQIGVAWARLTGGVEG